jgi:hypothetical protein
MLPSEKIFGEELYIVMSEFLDLKYEKQQELPRTRVLILQTWEREINPYK